jgi:hypothetical protein
MAELTTEQRVALKDQAIRNIIGMTGLLKADIAAAANGLDTYIHSNAGAINNAIPQPARSALTTAQKSKLLTLVLQARYEGGL